MTRRALVLSPLVLLAACPKSKEVSGQIDENLYLREMMDQDPSIYLGRFVADGVDLPNDAAASPTACTKLVSAKRVDVEGSETDFLFESNNKAGLSVSLPGLGKLGDIAYASQEKVWVHYTPMAKLVAHIEDPEAFEACCSEAEDRCTGRYIGEFILGIGEAHVAVEKKMAGKGKGSTPSVAVEGALERGEAWSRSTTFTEPTWFAFRTTDNLFQGCPTTDPTGERFVRTAYVTGAEAGEARARATEEARRLIQQTACSGVSSARCDEILKLVKDFGDSRYDGGTACASVSVPADVLDNLEQDVAAVELELVAAAQALVEARPGPVRIEAPNWGETSCQPAELGARLTSSLKANLAQSEVQIAPAGAVGPAVRMPLQRVGDTIRATVELVDTSGVATVLAGMTFAADAFGFDPGHPGECVGSAASQAPPRVPSRKFTRWRGPESGYTMVQLPSGRFTMGSPADEPGRDSSEGPVEVAVTRPFLMGTHEVTQELWKSVMDVNPVAKRQQQIGGSAAGSCAKYGGEALLGGSLPVHCVGWRETLQFANALSKADGLKQVYRFKNKGRIEVDPKADGYRLPTEAEWEYAARAGESRPYGHALFPTQLCHLGNVRDRSYDARFGGDQGQAFACDDGRATAAPVGSFLPNAWGLYDMQGNVYEWVWDREGALQPGDDPRGPSGGHKHHYRGGSWTSDPRQARLAARPVDASDLRATDVGLRLARQIPMKGKAARREAKRWAGDPEP